MFKLLKRYLKSYLKVIIVNILIIILQIVTQTVFLMGEMQKIIDEGVGKENMNYIMQSGIKMLVFTFIVIACTFIASYLSARTVAGVTCDIKKDCFEKVMKMSSEDFNKFGQSTLLTRTATDATQIQILMINFLRASLMVPIIVVCMLILIFNMNKLLFTILIVAFAFTVAYLIIKGAKSKEIFERLQQRIDKINLLMKEKITGVRSIRAYNNEELEIEKLKRANNEAYEMALEANSKLNFLSPTALIIMNWTVVIIYFAGSIQLKYKMASISDLLLIFQYLGYFISCLGIIPFLVNLMPKVSVASRRINELLETPIISENKKSFENSENMDMLANHNIDAKNSEEFLLNGAGLKTGISDGEIEFKNVIFGYSGAADVVTNISFKAKKGKTTAFIGTTGSGKTTILNLMIGLYRTTFGQIFIDGKEISMYSPEYLKSQISYATQQAQVFQDTAYNNITAYHDISKERIMKACDAAMFTEVLDKMPDGLNTVMSFGGMNISGGQRQRMSLARTLAKEASIYVFDDSFSALDAKTEKAVRKNVKEMLNGKTILMVAQKINTIMDADNIIVLDNGRIVGQGTHEMLLASCKEYKEIYDTQCYNRE